MIKRNTNRFNEGGAAQLMVEKTAEAYKQAAVLRLAKADPPLKVFGRGIAKKIIFLPNPFPDYIGAWTERAGRMLALEVKSTSEPRLTLNGNISETQIGWLVHWHRSGAAVGVLWNCGPDWSFLPIGQIKQVWDSGVRHIKFEQCDRISQGQGFVLLDFAANLRRWYPLPLSARYTDPDPA